MHDPAADAVKSKSDVEAASVDTPNKLNPVQGVFVAQKDARGRLRAKFVPVSTGISGSTEIEVLSGLNPGDEIVTGPYKILRNLKGGALLKRDTEPLDLNADNGS